MTVPRSSRACEEVTVPFRSRVTYVGHRAFGSGDGAVLIDREVIRKLRSAAEFAAQERRVAGGLLFGRGWADDQGAYLVIEDYLEAGPGENRDDRIRDDGSDDFTFSEADLRLLREDAARMFSGALLEAGWWRTRAALGDFGPQDFATQASAGRPRRRGPARVRFRRPLGHRLPGTRRTRPGLRGDARRHRTRH